MKSFGGQLSGEVVPLYVDLDGTLVATDTLWESVLLLIKKNPLMFSYLLILLGRGKANFKRELAKQVTLNFEDLPYRQEVLSFLRAEKATGKKIILASAADQNVAEGVARHLGLFDGVLGSNGKTNLSGKQKLLAIRQATGDGHFDYIGNSMDDVPLWQAARHAILVRPSSRIRKLVRRICTSQQVLATQEGSLMAFLKALRIHQWTKNLLLFVPLLAAHKLTDLTLIPPVLSAFVAMSLCASSIYIINDLLDLNVDRLHPFKKNRPFAAGALAIRTGVMVAPLLMITSLAVAAWLLKPLFVLVLIMYLISSIAYTFYFKDVLLLDVFVLAGLYSLRVLAGAVAIDIWPSPWLLAFSMFFFLSLAFLKRYSEVRLMMINNREHVSGRRYALSDIDMIRGVGPIGGYLSVLVLALYINSEDVVALYRYPTLLWLITPCLLYWITRMWFLAHRGVISEDPLVFAVKDRQSYIVGAIVLAIIGIAASSL
jgi:4-hydroxybenzoate polyprenyltransferase/phosphoserine phosphatase